MSKRLFALIFFLLPVLTGATHLRGGQITIASTSGFTCTIEVRVFINTASEVKFGEGTLNFGDGTTNITPTINSTRLPAEGDNLGVVVYQVVHTYAEPGFYVVSYTEPNLTQGILNVSNSGETRFYIETGINIDPRFSSFSSPRFPANPIFSGQSASEYSFSTAAIDDDESNEVFYKYSLVTNPKIAAIFEVPGNMAINENNGMITWDTKFHDQYYAGLFWIPVRVEKYSKSGQYYGYAVRAIQIDIDSSGDSTIDLSSSVNDPDNKLVVTDGHQKTIKLILSTQRTSSTTNLDIYYNKAIANNVLLSQHDSLNGYFIIATLQLTTTPDIVSDLPYPITIRGRANYSKDITFLYMTKDVDLPKLPDVITGLED